VIDEMGEVNIVLKERYAKQNTALLRCKIMVPGLTTKEILREVEKDGRLSGMKILFLTAVHLQEAEEEDLFAFKQVVGLIEKPFSV